MILVNTELLEVDSSSAANLDVHASFVDALLATGVVTNIGSQSTAISSAATTTVVAAVADATKVRRITFMSVRNRHATLACDVTIVANTATDVEIFKVTLLAGESLMYSEALGFYVLKSARMDRWMRVTGADYTNSTTAFTDVTGLTVPVLSGRTYNFETHLIHISGVSTSGFRAGLNGPTLSGIRAVGVDIVTASATAAALSAGVATAVDTAVAAETTGAATDVLQILSGVFTAGADGTFAIRAASEVAAIVTVRQGSWLHVWEPTG